MNSITPSGAWLLLERDSLPPIALPVPRQACLGLARAVLFSEGGRLRESGDCTPKVAWQAAWEHAGADAAVGAWLSSRESRDPAGRSLGRGLAESLVLGDDVRSGRAAASGFIVESAWAAVVASCGVPGAADSGGHDTGRRRSFAAELLERIGTVCGDSVAGPAMALEPSIEAIILRDAVRLAVSREAFSGRFEAAVAEARLAAMREMAYGAGHEINNPLANIAARAQALLVEEQDPDRRRRLSTIVDQAFRARDMIGGLMLFARPPKPQPRDTDIGKLMAAVIVAVEPLIAARGGRLEYSPPPFPLSVWADETQLEEAIRALVVNAVEAVDPGGRIVITVEGPVMLEARERGCVVHVTDNGRGMDEETVKRAFDPFFSGREAGRGIGLGLSKAWRLIDTNGGGITIDSKLGRGTRVSVTFPAPEEVPEPAARYISPIFPGCLPD